MMRRHLSSAAPLLLVAGVATALSACNACTQDKEDQATTGQRKRKAVKVDRTKKEDRHPEPKQASLSEHMLVVQVGDRAHLWSDGRQAALGIPGDRVSWSPHGFVIANPDGGVQILGPGAATWYQPKAPTGGTKPITEVLAAGGDAPKGYELKVRNVRDRFWAVQLNGPGGQRVRVGRYASEPTATAWLSAPLPEGTRAPAALTSQSGLVKGGDRNPKNAAPNGATVVEQTPSDEQSSAWTKDLRVFAGKDATIAHARVLDLDGDKAKEAFLCLSKASTDHSCFVADQSGQQWRYHPVAVPWTGGAPDTAPIAITKGDSSYVFYAGPPARAEASADPIAHVVRYTGAGYVVDLLD